MEEVWLQPYQSPAGGTLYNRNLKSENEVEKDIFKYDSLQVPFQGTRNLLLFKNVRKMNGW